MKFCPLCASPLQLRQIDQRERLACSANCGFVHWNNPTPVTTALVRYQGGILLSRNAGWPDGVFSMMSGFIEQDETPEQTVVREAAEELGLRVDDLQLIGHYPFEKFNQLVIAYAIEASGELRLNEEIAEVRLVSREELANYDFGRLRLTTRIVGDWLARGGA